MVQLDKTETSLKIVREFNAPVDKVYAAWANGDQMVQWMGPGEVKCVKADLDFLVGGRYAIKMMDDDCPHDAVGEYLEIVPNELIKFTWGWEGGEVQNTIVTITFEAVGDETKLTLFHDNFPSQDFTDKHQQGWQGCLESLSQYLI